MPSRRPDVASLASLASLAETAGPGRPSVSPDAPVPGGGPAGPRIDAAHWQRRLDALAERHGVPGAALGILRLVPNRRDELVQAATGVLNRNTGVNVTTDSVFQLGSISKVWTATLIMQLVDEGVLDLAAPIVEVLPEFRLADADAAQNVTAWHLLTHTSGIDGDLFTDTGRGDDCVERYVALLADVPRHLPLGVTFSYCNAGFAVLGRIIERLTGQTWDKALRERLIEPLGLTHTVTLPEEAILHRAAVGHLPDQDGNPTPATRWVLPRAIGPAGLIASTVADLLGFARLHLRGGLGPDGQRLLSAAAAADMTARHADLPDGTATGWSWGLAWIRYEWSGRAVIGHDGETVGQAAYLRILPEAGVAVALLTNGGRAGEAADDLLREIFAGIAGVGLPSPFAPPSPPPPIVDATRHLGRYERASQRIDVIERGGVLILRTTTTGPLTEFIGAEPKERTLVPVDDSGDRFAIRPAPDGNWQPVTFHALPTGMRCVHLSGRTAPKTD